MQTMAASFSDRIGAAKKIPVYRLTLEGLTDSYVSRLLDLAQAATEKVRVGLPGGVSHRINIEDGSSSIGAVTVPLIDIDAEITALISANTMRDRIATLSLGLVGMTDVSDFLVVHEGPVTGVSYEQATWDIEVSDRLDFLKKKIFVGCKNGEVWRTTAGVTDWALAETDIEARNAFAFKPPNGYMLVDEEIIQYSAYNPTWLNMGAWTTTASTNDATAANAFDGNAATAWTTVSDDYIGEWLRIDMGAEYTIAGMALQSKGFHPLSWKLELSTDDISWTEIFAAEGALDWLSPAQMIRYEFEPVTGRYVRITATDGPLEAGKAWKIFEIRFGEDGAAARFNTTVRGSLGTTAADHTDGTQIRELFHVTGNPLDILMRILTSKDGANGSWDTYYPDQGLAVDQADVDLDGISRQRTDWIDTWTFEFQLPADGTDAKRFIEEQLLRPALGVPVISQGGLISCRLLRPGVDADTTLLDAGEILGTPTLELQQDDLINQINVSYDYDIAANEYDTTVTHANTDSIRQYGRSDLFEVKLDGVRGLRNPTGTDQGGEAIIREYRDRLWQRHQGEGVQRIALKTRFAHVAQEVGDAVRINHPGLPDLSAGTRGITGSPPGSVMTIVERHIDLNSCLVDLDLEGIGYDRRYCLISDIAGNYTSGTAAQQSKYGWISDYAGDMSNGDTGYSVA